MASKCPTCGAAIAVEVCPRCEEKRAAELAATLPPRAAPDGAPGFAATVLRTSPPSGAEETLCEAPGTGPAGATDSSTEATRVPGSGVARTPAESPRRFGRYELISLLGQGSMGTVWKAFDPELGRLVALKQLRLEGQDGVVERFQREARLSARLRHEHIVSVRDVGHDGDKPYLTMDYVEGGTLAGWLAETRDLKRARDPRALERLEREVEVLAAIAEAVAYAHEQGVVHRDLKPGNVLLDRSGRPFVTDFGLAKEVAWDESGSAGPEISRVTRSGQMLGTPAYMSPEQANAEVAVVGPRVDVWALGVILYEVLTGDFPFPGRTPWEMIAAVTEREPAPPCRQHPAAPPDLERVCLAALVKDPARRTGSARAFAEDLRRWLRGEPVAAAAPARGERARRWLRRRARTVAAGAAVAFLILAATVSVLVDRHREAVRRREALAQCADAVYRFQHETMSTPLTPDAREELARQPLVLLAPILADEPDHATALAFRAWVFATKGEIAGAQREFDRACAADRGEGVPWLLRGSFRLQHYAGLRGLPGSRWSPRGVEFQPLPPETEEERSLREGGLADLARVSGTVPAEARVFDTVGRALAAGYSDRPEGWEEALRLLAGTELPGVVRLRGLAFYRLRRFEEARAAYHAAARLWSQDADLRYWYGLALQACAIQRALAGDDAQPFYAAAVGEYTEAGRLRPALTAACLGQRAAAWLELGIHQSSRRLDPRDAFRAGLTDLSAIGGTGAAGEFVLVTRSLALRLLGEAEQARGNDPRPIYQDAMALLDRLLAENPQRMDAWNGRGTLWQRLGEYESAVGGKPEPHFERARADFEVALAARPDEPGTRVNRAATRLLSARSAAGRGADVRATLAEVIADCDAALAADPKLTAGYNNRGCACLERAATALRTGEDPADWYRRAAADLEATLRLHPAHPTARRNRGRVRVEWARHRLALGEEPRPLDAEVFADLKFAFDQSDPEAARVLVEAYRLEGKVAEAVAAVEAFVRERPHQRAWAKGRIEATHPLAAYQGEPWLGLHFAGRDAAYAGAYLAAQPLLERALAAEAEARSSRPETERARRDADPALRTALAGDRYNLAYVEVLHATGRTHPKLAPAREVGGDERRLHVDRAFALLDAAASAHPPFRRDIAEDVQLDALRGDPRFDALVAERD